MWYIHLSSARLTQERSPRFTLSQECSIRCRCKMRMSALCKVEMSAFMDGRGAHGNGANHFESTRTGPIESVARGTAAASDAGCGSRAAESNRPPGAPDAAPHPRTG